MRHLTWTLLAGFLIVGCSEGDDVYIQSSAKQPVAVCMLAPGEDVCARSPETFANETSQIPLFEATATMAGIATRALTALSTSCEQMLATLGQPVPSLPTDASLQQRVTVLCTDAASALAALEQKSPVTVVVEPAVCSTTPPPPCARADAAARETCLPPKVTMTIAPEAAISATTLALLERDLAVVIGVRRMVEQLADLSSEVVNASAQGSKSLEAPCALSVIELVSRTSSDVDLAVRLLNMVVIAVYP